MTTGKSSDIICTFQERLLKWEQYRELSTSLVRWLRDAMAMMLDREFPTTAIEIKVSSFRFMVKMLSKRLGMKLMHNPKARHVCYKVGCC